MGQVTKLKYQHLFFDLDDTLWNFSHNISLTLENLYNQFGYVSPEKPFSLFLQTYKEINKTRWKEYQNKLLTKEQLNIVRFADTFQALNIGNSLDSKRFGDLFLERVPYQKTVVDGAFEVLNFLKNKAGIHIITNGFSELQYIKLRESGLDKYIDTITVSEHTGWQKPNKAIFEYAFAQSGATPENSLMIGDDYEADILGGMNIGMHTAHLNPHGHKYDMQATYTIAQLPELIPLLK